MTLPSDAARTYCAASFRWASRFPPGVLRVSRLRERGSGCECRYEFLELLVRLAQAKYVKGGRTKGLADALAFLFVEGIKVSSTNAGLTRVRD